jgi:iron complex outermembrane receptor protein
VNPFIKGPTYHRTEGVFGQFDYHWDDKLKLTAGLRYTSDSMYRHATFAGGPTPSTGWLNDQGGLCGPINGDCVGPLGYGPNKVIGGVLNDFGAQAATKFTWKLGAEYQFDPTNMVYVSVGTGYKSGGFNDYSPMTGGTAAYGPESNTSYEIGYKGRPIENVRLSTDFYYADYSQYQLTGATLLPGGALAIVPAVVINTTLAPTTMYGWENEATWSATAHDTFGLTLDLQRAYFNTGPHQALVGFIYPPNVPWGGHSMDNTPTVTATVSYDHTQPLADGASIHLHISSKLSSSYYESNLGSASPTQYVQPSYTRTDATLGYTTANGKYTIEGFVRNLEDGIQILNAPGVTNTTPPVFTTVRIDQPRTYGLRMSLKY